MLDGYVSHLQPDKREEIKLRYVFRTNMLTVSFTWRRVIGYDSNTSKYNKSIQKCSSWLVITVEEGNELFDQFWLVYVLYQETPP